MISWSDSPVFLVGGGPSLCDFDFARLEGQGIVCGINQSALDIEFCDAGISLDWRFLNERRYEVCRFAQRRPFYLVLACEREPFIPGVIHVVEDAGNRSLTSGHAALRLAVSKGAKQIILLGFDYYNTPERRNYHEAYWWHSEDNDRSLQGWAKQFAPVDGVEILNTNKNSLIAAYPKISIDEVLG